MYVVVARRKVVLTSTSDIVVGESGQTAISFKAELDRFEFGLNKLNSMKIERGGHLEAFIVASK